MKILGIDPGYERLGIAILEKPSHFKDTEGKKNSKEEVLFSECFQTKASLLFEERLFLLGTQIEKIIKQYKPKILSIEKLFLNTNQKTAMRVAEVRGMILYIAKKNNLEIFEATPPQIKNAITGYGHSTKQEMNKMLKMLINIDKNKNSDDELDAIAIALTAMVYLKK